MAQSGIFQQLSCFLAHLFILFEKDLGLVTSYLLKTESEKKH